MERGPFSTLNPQPSALNSQLSTLNLLGFTLIELILVMTVITIAVSVTAPALAHFFRGRSLDSEARRLLALTHNGQSRAVSEGLPVELWIDSAQGKFGLEAEPSFEPADPKAVEFQLANDMSLEVVNTGATPGDALNFPSASAVGTAAVLSNHPNLPKLRFLPDGSIAESSPTMLHLSGREGDSIWLAQSRNHLTYEIRSRASQ
jgi:prepilin-type N-terminal cleavage/methylation domain-containing protein